MFYTTIWVSVIVQTFLHLAVYLMSFEMIQSTVIDLELVLGSL